jgi:hypothetical protein
VVERKRLCARVGIKIFLKALKTFFVGENVCVCVYVVHWSSLWMEKKKWIVTLISFHDREKQFG